MDAALEDTLELPRDLAASRARLADDVRALLTDRCDDERSASLWVWGFASLIWSAGFPVVERHRAALGGVMRTLSQASPDHRGTPHALGRVATLSAAPACVVARWARPPSTHDAHDALSRAALSEWVSAGAVCPLGEAAPLCTARCRHCRAPPPPVVHGTLYRCEPAAAQATLDALVVREQAGYTALLVRVACADGVIRNALTFTSAPHGVYRVPADEDEAACAAIIATARGPSGSNISYLIGVLGAMRAREHIDAHLEALWACVLRQLDAPAIAHLHAQLDSAIAEEAARWL